MKEKWLPVNGFPNSEVSSLGRVRSLFRGTGNIRSQYVNARGYLIVGMQRKTFRKHARVHRLVAAAFLGPIPDGMDVNHKDGNKKNNRADNLEFMTRSENCKHSFSIGLSYTPFRERGEKHCRSVLRENDVIDIRKQFSEGRSRRDLASKYRVSYYTVWDITERRSWAHV
jgi:hypothetical protein